MFAAGGVTPVLVPCFSPVTEPSQSISRPFSSARRASVYRSTSAHGTGFLPEHEAERGETGADHCVYPAGCVRVQGGQRTGARDHVP